LSTLRKDDAEPADNLAESGQRLYEDRYSRDTCKLPDYSVRLLMV
jgi:hypothetical protein